MDAGNVGVLRKNLTTEIVTSLCEVVCTILSHDLFVPLKKNFARLS